MTDPIGTAWDDSADELVEAWNLASRAESRAPGCPTADGGRGAGGEPSVRIGWETQPFARAVHD